MVAVLPYMTRVIAGILLNGQALINHLPLSNRSKIDVEAFGVATILHDLGWSNNTKIVSKDKTFEVDGANAAREFLQQEGGRAWDKHRIQLVWDAIALHTNSEINPYKELEVSYTAAGTLTEIVGPEIAKQQRGDLITVTQAEWDTIVAEFPRQPGMKGYFTDLMIGFCMSKPQVTYSNFQGDYGEKYVEGYTRVGHRQIDLIEIVLPN